jgi:hypothetical protein
MLFLDANGVGTSRAVRIYKTYGNQCRQLCHRQTTVTLIHRLSQRVTDAGSDPDEMPTLAAI